VELAGGGVAFYMAGEAVGRWPAVVVFISPSVSKELRGKRRWGGAISVIE
jgi:hypothetical protein